MKWFKRRRKEKPPQLTFAQLLHFGASCHNVDARHPEGQWHQWGADHWTCVHCGWVDVDWMAHA